MTYKKMVPKTEARYAELSKKRGDGRLPQKEQQELNKLRGERKGKGKSYATPPKKTGSK